MGAGTVVSGDALRCFSEFIARKRAVRVNFLPEGLSGGRSGIQASPPLSPAGDPLPPCSDPWFPYQAREGGIWAVLRTKRTRARAGLSAGGAVSELLLESGVGPVSPSWETPACTCVSVLLLILDVIYLPCYIFKS